MSWPATCRFFDPATTNTSKIEYLLKVDSQYASHGNTNNIEVLVMGRGRRVPRVVATTTEDAMDIMNTSILENTTTVVYVRQRRLYFAQRARHFVGLEERTWLKLLEAYEVPPNALELIHDNNGGQFCNISEDEENGCTFHIGYKMGNWGNGECSVYARHELRSNKAFILVTGEVSRCLDKLEDLYLRAPRANIFHALLELASAELGTVERLRWNWDFQTQELESKTAFSVFQVLGSQPLPEDQLVFNRKDYVTLDGLRLVSWGSRQAASTFRALLTNLPRYATLCETNHNRRLSHRVSYNLKDALEQRISLADTQSSQIEHLRLRVQTQLEITRTLITQRDVQVNIQLASAAKRDSEIIRGIAFITMIFLPATFVATFFSMAIFGVTDDRLITLPGIWLYPAVTLPMTACIAIWYFLSSSDLLSFSRKHGNTAEEAEWEKFTSSRPPREKPATRGANGRSQSAGSVQLQEHVDEIIRRQDSPMYQRSPSAGSFQQTSLDDSH